MSRLLTKFVCWSHFGFGFFWCTLFFVPTTWWPDKISFHFFFSATVIGHQLIWGSLIKLRTGRFRPTCVLTTLTQRLRGFAISSPENYDHSFTKEIFGKVGIPMPQKVIRLLAFAIFTAVTVQYFLFR